jgi:8-oxo-dGTP diphosphatase
MKHIHVACAIIEHKGKVLCTQRSEVMSMPMKWEFPGGKIEPDELPEDCLRRELIEELGLYIAVGRALPPHTHSYHDFSGDMILHEHASFVWLPPEKLQTLDWAEADLPVIDFYFASIRAAAL